MGHSSFFFENPEFTGRKKSFLSFPPTTRQGGGGREFFFDERERGGGNPLSPLSDARKDTWGGLRGKSPLRSRVGSINITGKRKGRKKKEGPWRVIGRKGEGMCHGMFTLPCAPRGKGREKSGGEGRRGRSGKEKGGGGEGEVDRIQFRLRLTQ